MRTAETHNSITRKALWTNNKIQTNRADRPALDSKGENKIAIESAAGAKNRVAVNRAVVNRVAVANRAAVNRVAADRAAVNKVAADRAAANRADNKDCFF